MRRPTLFGTALAAALGCATPAGPSDAGHTDAGSCAPACAAGLTCQADRCIPTACGPDGGCPAPFTCQGGYCGQGSCDPPCPASQVCQNQICLAKVPGACQSETDCPPSESCEQGFCCTCATCDPSCPGGSVCLDALCLPTNGDTSCQLPYTACLGAGVTYCARLASDSQNCGACGTICPAGELCDGHGHCAVSCLSTELSCGTSVDGGAVCVDPLTDNAHCGSCSVSCPAGETCSGGSCAPNCGPGLLSCGGSAGIYCAQGQTDPFNCGVCGNNCLNGEVCAGGLCVGSCVAPFTACGTPPSYTCADLTRDPANCGGCGATCPSGAACAAGQCQAQGGNSGGTASSGTTSGGTTTGGTGGATSGAATSGATGSWTGGAPDGGCGQLGVACCGGTSCVPGLICQSSVCACNATSCGSGCCDANGCEAGSANGACGAAGAACEVCTSFQACAQGSCKGCGAVGQPCCQGASCDPSLSCVGGSCTCGLACAGCCDANGCESGTTNAACGAGGSACLPCAVNHACNPGGTCLTCGNIGQLCCADDAGIPAVCAGGLGCQSGKCACGPASCAGCCDAQGCENETVGSCGAGGVACTICQPGEQCQSAVCCGGQDDLCCANAWCKNGLACLGAHDCSSPTNCAPATPVSYQTGADLAPSALALVGGSVTTPASWVAWADAVGGGMIREATTAGTAKTLGSAPSGSTPTAIAVDRAGTTVYWIDSTTVSSCSLTDGGCNIGFAAGGPGPVAVDPTGSTLYWVGVNGILYSSPVGTGPGNPYAGFLVQTSALAVDVQGVYWTDSNSSVLAMVPPTPAGTVEAIEVGAAPTGGPGKMGGLALDPSFAYFGVDGTVQRALLTGSGDAGIIARSPSGGCVDAVAVDQAAVYWTDPCLGVLYRQPLCGSPLEALWNQNSFGGRSEQMSLAVDSANVYWTDPNVGTVLSFPK